MLTVNRPGSLITPTYFLSAAHCNNILIPMPPVGNKDKVRQTRSGSKTCRRFVRWDSYMYSLPRLMNTEKSVWGQQKMMVFLRWVVFIHPMQWLMGTSAFEHPSWFNFQIPINMGGLPRSLNYKLKCRWLRRTRAFEFIAEPAVTKLSTSFYRPASILMVLGQSMAWSE